ncbi:coiled-coil domain-containing protein 187 isoform X4 [Ascaphus truei]|uniref:coiled-coil domain-containing protein 187 isoform X4 n=1 Tax=Ascaphus truei TaxID=8439 RepID=UPI003F59A774
MSFSDCTGARIMFAGDDWDTCSREELSHLHDVSLAWDSLFKAKQVLQMIENKIEVQDQHHAQAQKIRRRLQLERNSFSDAVSCKSAVMDCTNFGKEEKNDPKADDGFCLGSREEDGHTFVSSTMDHPLGHYVDNSLSSKAPFNDPNESRKDIMQYSTNSGHQNPVSIKGVVSLNSVSVADNSSSEEQTEGISNPLRNRSSPANANSEEETEEVSNPYLDRSSPNVEAPRESGHCLSSVTLAPLLSPKADLYVQKLEFLKSKSPNDKLERLKIKIREQRQGRCASKETEPSSWRVTKPFSKRILKRKVRKVTFAPPPPVYKGFSAVHEEPGTLFCEEVTEEAEGPKHVNHADVQRTCPKTHIEAKLTKEHLKRVKHKGPISRKLSFPSPSAEKKARRAASDLYGASAWREGQKLVRKLLGPSPVLAKQQRVSCGDDRITHQPGKWKSACQKTGSEPGPGTNVINPKIIHHAKSSQGTSTESVDRRLSRDVTQVLQDLKRQQYVGKSSSGSNTPDVSVGRGETPNLNIRLQTERRQIRENVAGRAKSASPKGIHTTLDSWVQKRLDKENLKEGEERRAKSSKICSYSVEEVRGFMNKKIAERHKKEREERKSAQTAEQLQQRRLQDVYKKQKDAFPQRKRDTETTTAAKESSDFTQGQPCVTEGLGRGRRNIDEWVELTSTDLLREDHRSRTCIKRRTKAEPTEKAIHVDYSGPLILQDLEASYFPSHKHIVSFTERKNTNSDSKPTSPNRASKLSQYINNQERVQAICAKAKELGERVELEASRLRATSIHQYSGSKEATSSHNSPSRVNPLGIPRTEKSPRPAALAHENTDKLLCIGGAEGGNANKQMGADSTSFVSLCSHSTVSEDLPWISDSEAKDAVVERLERKPHKGCNKGYNEAKIFQIGISPHKHHVKRTHKDSSVHGSTSRSSQKGTRQHNDCRRFETFEGALCTSPKVLRKANTSSSPRRKNGIAKDSDKKKKYSLHPQEERLGRASDVYQTRKDIINKLKTQNVQQEQQLAILRRRAELEAREAETCMEELLKRNTHMWVKSDVKSVGSEHKGEADAQRSPCGRSQMTECRHTDDRVNDNLPGCTESPTTCTASGECLQGVSFLGQVADSTDNEREVTEDSGDQSEPITDSTSKWSEISQFYGSPTMFSRFTLEMTQQYLREEELRARHQAALLRLREEALKEKTKAELALLENQRMCLEMKADYSKVQDNIKKQREILTNLKQEQAEIRHMHNIYRAAHQERKLLLKQQKEVFRMHQSAAHMQQKLQSSEVTDQFSGEIPDWTQDSTLFHPTVSREQTMQNTSSAVSDLLVDDSDPMENQQAAGNDSILIPRGGSSNNDTEFPEETPVGSAEMQDEVLAGDDKRSDRNLESQDGTLQGNPSPPVEEPTVEAVQNNLSNLNQKFPAVQENVCNHSQEKQGSDHEEGYELFSVTAESTMGSPLEQSREAQEADTEKPMQEIPQQHSFAIVNKDEEVAADRMLTSEPNSHQCSPIEKDCSLRPCEHVSETVSTQSQDLSQPLLSAESCPSLAEFQKVSAFLINISESSVSVSDKGEDAQDTESGDSEVFDMESTEVSKETQTSGVEESYRKSPKQLLSNKYMGKSTVTLPDKHFLDNSAALHHDNLREALGEETMLSHLEHTNEDLKGQFLHTINESTDDYKEDMFLVKRKLEHDEDQEILLELPKSPLCYRDDFYHGDGSLARLISPRVAAHVEHSDQAQQGEEEDTLISANDTKEPIAIAMEESENKVAPLASESFPTSEDLSESDTKTYGKVYLTEEQTTTVVKRTNTQKSKTMISKDASIVAGISSSDIKDLQTVTKTNEKQSVTEKLISKKTEMVPLQATSSKDVFQFKSFPLQSEGDIIFIADEVLQPIEDTLSEILSPVDEVLSYQSADLYSSKNEFSYHSDDLPSLPEDVESMKSDDINIEDFPTPPDQIILSSNESMLNSLEGSLSDGISLLYDDVLTEDVLLPPAELTHEAMANDGKSLACPLEAVTMENSSGPVKTHKPFLTLSKAEEDSNDPLFTFEIGDRILVTHSKPGTLKFKGLTSFEEGFWAGVALDKSEGDHNGTYEGVKYFECPRKCGVFARPGQISHLLEDDRSVSDYIGNDDNSFDEGPSPGNVRSREQKGDKNEVKVPSEARENKSRSCGLESSKSSNKKRITDPDQHIEELLYEDGQKAKFSGNDRAVKLRVTEEIIEMLITDTIRVAGSIYWKKAQPAGFCK